MKKVKKQESGFEVKFNQGVRELIEKLKDEGEENPGVSITFKGEKVRKWNSKQHFIKVYDDMFSMIDQFKLNAYELATIMKLLQYVEYETNLIARDGIALNKKDLIEILNYGEHQIENILNSLVQKKVLAKTKVGRNVIYHLSPYIAFRGINLSSETESIFRNLDN